VAAGLAALAVLAVPSAAQAVTAANSAGKILRTRHVRITGVAVPAS
jgi:hypothetical protein